MDASPWDDEEQMEIHPEWPILDEEEAIREVNYDPDVDLGGDDFSYRPTSDEAEEDIGEEVENQEIEGDELKKPEEGSAEMPPSRADVDPSSEDSSTRTPAPEGLQENHHVSVPSFDVEGGWGGTGDLWHVTTPCLLYTSPSPRDA